MTDLEMIESAQSNRDQKSVRRVPQYWGMRNFAFLIRVGAVLCIPIGVLMVVGSVRQEMRNATNAFEDQKDVIAANAEAKAAAIGPTSDYGRDLAAEAAYGKLELARNQRGPYYKPVPEYVGVLVVLASIPMWGSAGMILALRDIARNSFRN